MNVHDNSPFSRIPDSSRSGTPLQKNPNDLYNLRASKLDSRTSSQSVAAMTRRLARRPAAALCRAAEMPDRQPDSAIRFRPRPRRRATANPATRPSHTATVRSYFRYSAYVPLGRLRRCGLNLSNRRQIAAGPRALINAQIQTWTSSAATVRPGVGSADAARYRTSTRVRAGIHRNAGTPNKTAALDHLPPRLGHG